MADPTTDNLGMILMATGTGAGTWGQLLNDSNFSPLDTVLGSTQSVTVAGTNVTLTATQRQNLAFAVTGTLSANVSVSYPLNQNNTSEGVGALSVWENNATGSFSLTVKTAASGSTGVTIPQGVRSALYSDGLDVKFADDAQNRTEGVNGDPNGTKAGTAASAVSRASRAIDYNTNEEYICTTGGAAAAAVWSKNLPYSFASQGYLSLNASQLNVVLQSDSVGATTIYYTAFHGNQFFVYNGVSFVPVTIAGGQLSLSLSSTFQVANRIYDVIGFVDSGTPRIGFSPAWSVSTAGSGSRGSGAGTAQIGRTNGILVNTVSQTVNNGATTYTVDAGRGTYLGSVLIDSTNGQVTCHTSYGQSRKWGVWNYYNRLPIYLQAGDSAGSWTPTSNYPTFQAANGDSTNRITVLTGMPEESVDVQLNQLVQATDATGYVGIGLNSTSANSGEAGAVFTTASGATVPMRSTITAKLRMSSDTGINNLQALQSRTLLTGGSVTMLGSSTFMMLSATYSG